MRSFISRSIRLLVTLLALTVVSLFLAGATSASWFDRTYDWRSGKNTWYIAENVPDAWYTVTINGALVWDNIQGISHDFVRYQGPPADFFVGRVDLGVKGGTLASTSPYAYFVLFDDNERWHLNTSVKPQSTSVDLWSVAAHEMGHILSLGHCETYTNCEDFTNKPTMYSKYDYGWSWARTLETYDKNHAKNLYP